MVQVISPRDIGGDIGRSVGGGIGTGFGDAMKLLTEGDISRTAIEELGKINFKGMNPQQIHSETFKAFRYAPQLQKQAGEIAQRFNQIEQARAYKESQIAGARQREDKQRNLRSQNVQGPSGVGADGLPAQDGVIQVQEDLGGQGIPGGQGTPGGNQQDLREIPLTADQDGQDLMPTSEEIETWLGPSMATGDREGMQKAMDGLMESKKLQRDAKIEDARIQREELTAKRALEGEQAQMVLGKTKSLLEANGLTTNTPIKDESGEIIGYNKDVPEQWNRLAYKYYNDERKKPENKHLSDEYLWQESGRRLERKIGDIVTAKDKHWRPTWRMDKTRRAEGAKKWAQEHLDNYGNTDEDRQLLNTVLIENEWRKDEAQAITQPMSSGLTKAIDSAGQRPRDPTSSQFIAQSPMREEEIKTFMDDLVPKLQESFLPTDPMGLLKNNLVRTNHLTDEQAVEVINRMLQPYQGKDKSGKPVEKKIKLQPHQIRDLNSLQENVRPSPYDIWFGDRRAIELMEPIIK